MFFFFNKEVAARDLQDRVEKEERVRILPFPYDHFPNMIVEVESYSVVHSNLTSAPLDKQQLHVCAKLL
jgi:hypothetical protein